MSDEKHGTAFGRLFDFLYRIAVLLVLAAIAWQLYELRDSSVDVYVRDGQIDTRVVDTVDVAVSSLPWVRVSNLP